MINHSVIQSCIKLQPDVRLAQILKYNWEEVKYVQVIDNIGVSALDKTFKGNLHKNID